MATTRRARPRSNARSSGRRCALGVASASVGRSSGSAVDVSIAGAACDRYDSRLISCSLGVEHPGSSSVPTSLHASARSREHRSSRPKTQKGSRQYAAPPAVAGRFRVRSVPHRSPADRTSSDTSRGRRRPEANARHHLQPFCDWNPAPPPCNLIAAMMAKLCHFSAGFAIDPADGGFFPDH